MKDKRRSAGEADSDMGGQEDGDPRLAALLAGAVRDDAPDPGAEERALAAFRRARDRGAHGTARTRRRDDWRPAGERRGRPVRTTLIALAASATLGGVAVAAIGSGVVTRHEEDGRDRPRPSSSAPADPGGGTPGPSAPGTSGGPGGPDDPSGRSTAAQDPGARDIAAHCRAYDSAGKKGGTLDPAAWQRLVRAAGGADRVGTYCAARTEEPGKSEEPKKPKEPKPSEEPKEPKKPKESKESNGSNGSSGSKDSKEKKEKKNSKEKNSKEKKDTGTVEASESAGAPKPADDEKAGNSAEKSANKSSDSTKNPKTEKAPEDARSAKNGQGGSG